MYVTIGCLLAGCVLMWVHVLYELLKGCTRPLTLCGNAVGKEHFWKTAPNNVCKDDRKLS